MEALDAFKVESVNVGLAKLNLVSNIRSGFQITRINGAGQAIYRVIRHFDCFWNGLECQNRQHRSEDLILHNLGILRDIGNHSWFVEESTVNVSWVTTCLNLAACFNRSLNQTVHFIKGALIDQRTHFGIWISIRITDFHRRHLGRHFLNKLIRNIFLHINPFSVVTNLPIVINSRVKNGLHS